MTLVPDASPPAERELAGDQLPADYSGSLGQVGKLLCRWLSLQPNLKHAAKGECPSKHRSTAEVFPLPCRAFLGGGHLQGLELAVSRISHLRGRTSLFISRAALQGTSAFAARFGQMGGL